MSWLGDVWYISIVRYYNDKKFVLTSFQHKDFNKALNTVIVNFTNIVKQQSDTMAACMKNFSNVQAQLKGK